MEDKEYKGEEEVKELKATKALTIRFSEVDSMEKGKAYWVLGK